MIWGLGAALDNLVSKDLLAEGVGRVCGLRLQADSQHRVRHRCALYALGAWQACEVAGPQFLSGAVDKSRVLSFGMQVGAFALPSNEAWWAPVQDRLMCATR